MVIGLRRRDVLCVKVRLEAVQRSPVEVEVAAEGRCGRGVQAPVKLAATTTCWACSTGSGNALTGMGSFNPCCQSRTLKRKHCDWRSPLSNPYLSLAVAACAVA